MILIESQGMRLRRLNTAFYPSFFNLESNTKCKPKLNKIVIMPIYLNVPNITNNKQLLPKAYFRLKKNTNDSKICQIPL